MKKLFGTDGIRGVANQYPMTAETAVRLGRAVTRFFAMDGHKSKVIIGKDTRISGDMLESAVVSGICSAGGDAYLTGVLPSPGVAFTAASLQAIAGIVISASHNPYYDNGIKIFKGDGYKLSDDVETQLEKLILDDVQPTPKFDSHYLGTARRIDSAKADYVAFLKYSLPTGTPFKGMKIVLDCSNGATYQVAPQLFNQLGADVESLAIQPDGTNINDHCGSENPQNLIEAVVEQKAEIGLAFDGDGDRLIAVDETGKVLSGDTILAICARAMKQKGTLKNNLVISTVMSNMGFGVALKKMGISHEMTRVGDRYVMERMITSGAVLGGEDSGHMIFADHHTTGDGLLTALRLIEALQSGNMPLSGLSKIMTEYPQILVNIDVQAKPDLENVPQIMDAIRTVESELGNEGRVLVRYSGTQPICRIMVEGPNETDTRRYCRQLADIIKDNLGAQ